MKDVDPRLPMFYEKTGQPVELVATEPLVQYRVRYSSGGEAVLSASELARQMTNRKPRYRFLRNFNGGYMKVSGNEDTVRFYVAQCAPFGKMQELSLQDVRELSEKLAQWVQERDNEG